MNSAFYRGYIGLHNLLSVVYFAVVALWIIPGVATGQSVSGLPSAKSTTPWKVGEQESLSTQLEQVIARSGLDVAHVGVMILPIAAVVGEPLQYNADRLFVPASTLKLVTTAAAFDLLGGGYTFTTTVGYTGSINNGVLHGDLIFQSNGDPSFSAKWCPAGDSCMDELAQQVVAQGIRTVQGNLVADVSRFTGPTLGPAWEWDDLSYYYATPVTPLNCNENTVEVSVVPGKVGGPPAVSATPSGYAVIENHGLTQAQNEDFSILRNLGSETVVIRGGLAARGRGVSAAVSVNNPALYFLHTARSALQRAGVVIHGVSGEQIADNKMQATAIYSRPSPPLREIATVVNMESHNLFAELLQHALGLERTGKGSFAAGSAQVEQWLKSLGIDCRGASIVDGSGLSRKNLISPKTMAEMLRVMTTRPAFAEFYASMPVAGRHGSMARRLVGTKGDGVVHGKVGYVTGHSSMMGYAQDQLGRWFAFAIMVNNSTVTPAKAREMQDAIVTLLVGR